MIAFLYHPQRAFQKPQPKHTSSPLKPQVIVNNFIISTTLKNTMNLIKWKISYSFYGLILLDIFLIWNSYYKILTSKTSCNWYQNGHPCQVSKNRVNTASYNICNSYPTLYFPDFLKEWMNCECLKCMVMNHLGSHCTILFHFLLPLHLI